MIEVSDKYQHVGSIPSPAACPTCGSMSLSYPFRGRRTGLWLSTCYDCSASVRSVEPFSVSERYRVKVIPHAPDWSTVPSSPGMQLLRNFGMTLFQKPARSREPGEEG